MNFHSLRRLLSPINLSIFLTLVSVSYADETKPNTLSDLKISVQTGPMFETNHAGTGDGSAAYERFGAHTRVGGEIKLNKDLKFSADIGVNLLSDIDKDGDNSPVPFTSFNAGVQLGQLYFNMTPIEQSPRFVMSTGGIGYASPNDDYKFSVVGGLFQESIDSRQNFYQTSGEGLKVGPGDTAFGGIAGLQLDTAPLSLGNRFWLQSNLGLLALLGITADDGTGNGVYLKSGLQLGFDMKKDDASTVKAIPYVFVKGTTEAQYETGSSSKSADGDTQSWVTAASVGGGMGIRFEALPSK